MLYCELCICITQCEAKPLFLLCSPQSWLTFAPVADQTAQYLRISLDLVNWLSLVYVVVAIFFSFITTWVLDTLGLRFSVYRTIFLSAHSHTANIVKVIVHPKIVYSPSSCSKPV